MNRSKKQPAPSPVIERGRDHRRFVDSIMDAVERGEGVHHEEVLVLVTEIRDLRAHLSALTRGVPSSIGLDSSNARERS